MFIVLCPYLRESTIGGSTVYTPNFVSIGSTIESILYTSHGVSMIQHSCSVAD